MGGGGFSMEPDNPLLDDFVLSHARRTPARVCFVATASGDQVTYVADFYRAFAWREDCRASDLRLFERGVADLRAHVLDQDVVYVGGGSTANLLAVWRGDRPHPRPGPGRAAGHLPFGGGGGGERLVRESGARPL